ncbi:Gamma-glutamyl cyclotransferase, AIG2-like [Halogranum gelatinilyticum]|uniref:Gamma-glutamyl cyclotransferase, AIG2-like n=1 Tax=Halogranum gelatinilyticum TaxID=660521 RepID=A0A1G9Q2B4_9EURY|nr:gamma-glutamylcyclotransferase family protein [Halogranum gelatinilyticum]SDM05164.1 Gamma-glutamyl cyclotransferase, AIG2-like [Halogranum gelatinilyticum]
MDFFVYGTLTNPEQVAQVVDSYSYLGAAVLDGLHPVSGRYPTLAPGGSVGGRVLRTDDVDAVDTYEGVGQGLYVRVEVPWRVDGNDGGDGDATAGDDGVGETVAVYVGDPDELDAEEEISWPGDGSLAERVRRYVARESVTVSWTD